MNKKSEYRLKIALYFLLLGLVTFLILYLTAPAPKSGPQIRVLLISYSGQVMTTTQLKTTPFPDNIVVISLEELNLSGEHQPFYKNNIVLDCTAHFPVTWSYEGYGMQQVEVQNARKFENYKDITTYSYSSSLNLMPVGESSSGKYFCFGVDPDEKDVAFVQIFVPGPKIFLLQQDLTVESDMREELLIPCQVSDPMANISLLMKGEEIDSSFIKSYHPAKGFVLNAKFMEENDPLSTFVCQDKTTKRRSGRISVSLKKDSLVLPIPPQETVHFSPQFNGTFSCHAKENVTLKFRRIQNSKKVEYFLNLSSEFGFQALVHFQEADLRDGSVVSCLTIGQGSPLHIWTVSLTSSKQEEIGSSTKLFYKSETDEYLCCQRGKIRPKFVKLTCSHPTECRVGHNCFTLDVKQGDETCQEVTAPPRTSDEGLCLHYRVEYDKQSNISTGELKCGSGPLSTSQSFVNVKAENETIFQSSVRSDENDGKTSQNLTNFLFGVETIAMKGFGGSGAVFKYRCRGPKYFFASGFVWQVAKYGGNVDYIVGKDYYNGAWMVSEVQFEEPFAGLKLVTRIYCIAPVWNSLNKFVFKYTDVNSTLF